MINDESESLFAYNRPNENFEAFRDLGFKPIFVPTFDTPEEEQRANDICGDNEFCLFDISATKNDEIAISTMEGVVDFDNLVEVAEPSESLMIIYLNTYHVFTPSNQAVILS